MRNICYIVGASDYDGITIYKKNGDFIIAADGGYKKLIEMNITPDLVVGDFDSYGIIPDFNNLVVHPVEKDDTDMGLAISEGIKAGMSDFIIYGGLGNRLDHTLANIQNASYFVKEGYNMWLWGNGQTIAILNSSSISFDKDMSGIISIFAIDKALGVTIEGLKYNVNNIDFTNLKPLGVSNEFTGSNSTISVKNGILIVMYNESSESLVNRVYND